MPEDWPVLIAAAKLEDSSAPADDDAASIDLYGDVAGSFSQVILFDLTYRLHVMCFGPVHLYYPD